MPETLQLGPFLLKTQWLVIALSVLAGYVVFRYRLKAGSYPPKQIAETIENSLVIAVVLWKFSLVIFHPVRVITNPLALLYFSGGERGVWLAAVVVILYLYYRSKKDQVSIWVYGDLLAVGSLAASAVYHMIFLFLTRQTFWANLSQALISLIILLAILLKTKAAGKPYYLTRVVLWFSLGRVFSAYLDPLKQNYIRGFSKEQILFLLLAILSFTIDWFIEKRKLKKV